MGPVTRMYSRQVARPLRSYADDMAKFEAADTG
jgi:hypothetical protein